MSATWDLKLGRRTIMWAKRYVPDELLLVFNDWTVPALVEGGAYSAGS